MGCVTGVTRPVVEGFVDECCALESKADVFELPAAGPDTHIVAGEACLAESFAEEHPFFAGTVGVVAGAALGAGVEKAVVVGLVGRALEVVLVAFAALAEDILAAEHVTDGGLVGVVAFYTTACIRRVEDGVLVCLGFCVALEAQFGRLRPEKHFNVRRMIGVAAVAPLFEEGGMADQTGLVVPCGMALAGGACLLVVGIEGCGGCGVGGAKPEQNDGGGSQKSGCSGCSGR